jgi:hypothetical protein
MRGVDIIRTMLAWFANVTPENLEQEISTAFCLFDVGPALLLPLPTSPPTPRHPSYPSVPPSLPLSLSLTYPSVLCKTKLLALA